MITHYDIKTETQKLKDVLSVEGVNIPPLLQVIKLDWPPESPDNQYHLNK